MLPLSVFALRDYSNAFFLFSFLFLQKDEKCGSERLKFQRSEFVHRFVTGIVSGFSTSAFLLHLFKDRGKTPCASGVFRLHSKSLLHT